MFKYVWTARNKFGNSVVREVSANTIEESKAMLLAEGCTELVLKGDEISDVATSWRPRPVMFLGEEIKVSAADKLKHRGKPAPTYFSALWQGINETKSFLFLILALALFEIYRGNFVSLMFVGLGLIAWIAFLMVLRLPSINYARLHKAADWSRWAEVLQIVASLKKIGKIHFSQIPPQELGFYRAKALAGMGKLPEALEEFSQYNGQPDCPSWFYKTRVSAIYSTARQYDKALEYALEAIREKPTPLLYLDLTNRYLRYLNDPVRARAALAEAEKSTLPDLAIPYHLRCLGILAFLEGDYSTARQKLEESLEMMQKNPHVPFRTGHISIANAYLCCVSAKQGDLATARKNFQEAEEYLIATDETELLEQCKHALGT